MTPIENNNFKTNIARLPFARPVKHFLIEWYDPFPYRSYMRKNKCVFIHIPKAAGTSIKVALRSRSAQRDHFAWHVYKSANASKFDCYFKFTIVRNPWDRFYSTYNYLFRGGNGHSDLKLSCQIKKFKNFCEFARSDFAHMCHTLHPLFKPQVSYICDQEGRFMVDFVGRFESLEADFGTIITKLNLKSRSLPCLNKLQSSDYRQHYSTQSIEAVAYLYRLDIEKLIYKFD